MTSRASREGGAAFFSFTVLGYQRWLGALRFRRGLQRSGIAKLDADFVLRAVGRAMTHPARSQDAVVFRADLHYGGERDTLRIGNASARF